MGPHKIWGRYAVLVVMLLQLSSCGGGGGGGSGSGASPPPPPPVTASFAVTPTTMTYTAQSVNFPAPIQNFVVGTVSGTVTGTLYINIVVTGPAVKTVDNLTVSGGSGSAGVMPQDPWVLGAGTFASTLTVHACQGDQTCKTGELNGSPQVVNVTYTIPNSPVIGMSPSEVASGLSGDLVLRWVGGSTVSTPAYFWVGTNMVSAFTHPDPITFTLTYPALVAGSYQVKTDGGTSFGSLTVLDVPAFAAASLSYPATPGGIADVLYDTVGQELLVATRNADPTTNQLLSYSYSTSTGTWSAAAATPESGLRHIRPMGQGEFMLVNATEICYFHYLTTCQADIYGPPAIFTGAASTNAGYSLLTLEDPTSTSQSLYIVSFIGPGAVPFLLGPPTPAGAGGYLQPTIAASGDGSRVVIVSASGAASKIVAYDSTHELLSPTAVVFNHNGTGRAPALDRRATRIVVSNDTATNVYDGSFNLLGTLPTQTQAYVVNSAGTRVYTYDDTPQIQAFDVSLTASGAAYAPLGAPVAVPAVGMGARMSISLDDQTLFVAGTAQVIVQPVP